MSSSGAHEGWCSGVAAGGVALLLVLPGLAWSAQSAGRVISANGDVTAVRAGESARSLDLGQAVREGDEIRTGPDGRVQIRFHDGGLVALKSATRFAIDRYGPDEDGSGSSALMRFLQGALRTVTGAISDDPGDTYQMKTSIATIGVRGTGYALEYCDRDCARRGEGQPGLYGRVDEGVIRVSTPGSSADFAAGDYLFVPAARKGGLPQPILRPPSGILEGDDEVGAAGAYRDLGLDLPPGLAMMDQLPPGLAGRDDLPPGLGGDGPPGPGSNGPGSNGPGSNGPPGLGADGPPGVGGNGPLRGRLPPGPH